MDAFKRKCGIHRKYLKKLAQDSTFRVKYLGYVLNPKPGIEGIRKAVARIINESGEAKKERNEVNWLRVTENGISIFKNRNSVAETFVELQKISYCTLQSSQSDVFAFNHHVSKEKVECHAVQCENHKSAQAVSSALYSAFKGAHFTNLRESRQKLRETLQGDPSKVNNLVGKTEAVVRRSETQGKLPNGIANGETLPNVRCKFGGVIV